MERRYARAGAVLLLTAGCLIVLRPFLPAMLFAAAVAISSWPLYLRLLRHFRGRRSLAALTMTMSLTLLVIVPLALVAYRLADNIAQAFDAMRAALDQGELLPPQWLRDIPLVGQQFDDYLLQLVASRERMMALLSALVFVSSLIPLGAPVIWGGAALWLFAEGRAGWGVFMLVWGFFGISGVDNVVRPILISRGSSLPFLLTFLGVLGGVIAFGVVGIFIGPTLLAVGYALLSGWTHAGDPIVRQDRQV